MKRRTRRRLANAALLLLGLVGLWWAVRKMDSHLVRTPHVTGYAMFASLLVLASYGLRKRFAAAPMGSSAAWLQVHLYLGLGSAGLFLVHTSGRWPNGWLETTLAAAFWGTFASGLIGLYLTRTIPRQLARTSEEFVYERIPRLRREVLDQSRVAVFVAASQSGATTLADFYCDRLDPYLAAPRSAAYALRPTGTLRLRLMRELSDLRRFLDEAEIAASEKLFALVRKKDDLDFHEARQGLLKQWLFVHIALTGVLLTAGALHGWLALMMRGGPG